MADGGEDPQATAAVLGAAAGVLAASGIGPFAGVGAAMAQVLRVEGETLTTFKKRVDDLLTQLEESKAAPRRIAEGALPSGRLGTFDDVGVLPLRVSRRRLRLRGPIRSLGRMKTGTTGGGPRAPAFASDVWLIM
ncbi:hypothetical protein [Streptomyces sp. JNUCC 63]